MKRKITTKTPGFKLRRTNITVLFDKDDNIKNRPFCEHGPCLLFERSESENDKDESDRFYACSVYRDRKACRFFVPANNVSKFKQFLKEESSVSDELNHKSLFRRLKQFKRIPIEKRCFCVTCQALVLNEEFSSHNGHDLNRGVSNAQLKNPSKLLKTLDNKDKEAQYWFSKSTVNFLCNEILRLKYDGVLCIGAPRLFESLRKVEFKDKVKSFLLDYDERYAQFFAPKSFARFNMFVNYFYDETGRKNFQEFFASISRLLIIIDPPFGGLASPIARTLNCLETEFQNVCKFSNGQTNCFWIFPYFLESKIREYSPSMSMLDYQVEYENHPLFNKKKTKSGSPIRIFTDLPLELVKLPEDNYRFCKKCNKSVAKTNKHCDLCKCCPSKDGKTYVHCQRCSNCVKPTYVHCTKCQKCHLPNDGCLSGKKSFPTPSVSADVKIDANNEDNLKKKKRKMK